MRRISRSSRSTERISTRRSSRTPTSSRSASPCWRSGIRSVFQADRRVAAYYGITSRQGVFLAEVSSGSPAEAAGLQVGDVLTSLGGRALGGVADLVDGLRERAIGDTIDIQAERRGQALRVKAKLA